MEKIYAPTMMLVRMVCGQCGVPYAMPEALYDECKKDSRSTFYCPNGHSRCFRKSDADVLREQLAEEEARRKRVEVTLACELSAHDSTRNSLRAQKAANTRVLNRVHNGVCPVCKRHFCNLERHMKGQHPKGGA